MNERSVPIGVMVWSDLSNTDLPKEVIDNLLAPEPLVVVQPLSRVSDKDRRCLIWLSRRLASSFPPDHFGWTILALPGVPTEIGTFLVNEARGSVLAKLFELKGFSIRAKSAPRRLVRTSE